LKQIDPLHIGINQGYLDILKQYPAGNDPAYGADGGFASPAIVSTRGQLDNRAYVGKMDFMLTSRQTLSVRGTLSNATRTIRIFWLNFRARRPPACC